MGSFDGAGLGGRSPQTKPQSTQSPDPVGLFLQQFFPERRVSVSGTGALDTKAQNAGDEGQSHVSC